MKKLQKHLLLLTISGILVNNFQDTMATVDQPMVQTVLLAEYSRLTGWFPCGKKANGRGGLEKSIVAGILVSSLGNMMVTVVQTMVHNALRAMMSFWGIAVAVGAIAHIFKFKCCKG